MLRKYLALAITGLLLLSAFAACGEKPEPAGEPFASARRILAHSGLPHDAEGAVVVAPGEVLVFFTYMDPFDAETWQTSMTPQIAWAAEAVDHAASQENMGEKLRDSSGNDDGGNVFSGRVDYIFGIAVTET